MLLNVKLDLPGFLLYNQWLLRFLNVTFIKNDKWKITSHKNKAKKWFLAIIADGNGVAKVYNIIITRWFKSLLFSLLRAGSQNRKKSTWEHPFFKRSNHFNFRNFILKLKFRISVKEQKIYISFFLPLSLYIYVYDMLVHTHTHTQHTDTHNSASDTW